MSNKEHPDRLMRHELASWLEAGGEAELLATVPARPSGPTAQFPRLTEAERLLEHAVDLCLCELLADLEPLGRLVLRLRWGASGMSRDEVATLLDCAPRVVLAAERRGTDRLVGRGHAREDLPRG